MDYKVALALSARSDIRDIVRYISFDAPERALDFGRFLVSKVKALGQFPEMGRVVPEFNDSNLREIVVRSYRVIYRVDHVQQKIEVVRFWHAARGDPEIHA